MRPRLPSILIYSDLIQRARYLYYSGYSMRKVSKKEKKINERLSRRQAARRRMEVGSDVEFLLSCREGCDVETRRRERGMVRRYSTPTSKSNGENKNVEKVN